MTTFGELTVGSLIQSVLQPPPSQGVTYPCPILFSVVNTLLLWHHRHLDAHDLRVYARN